MSWESPYPGKMVFILRQGPGWYCVFIFWIYQYWYIITGHKLGHCCACICLSTYSCQAINITVLTLMLDLIFKNILWLLMISNTFSLTTWHLWPSYPIWWHRSRLTLTQVMACRLMIPSYYLNQCRLIIKGGLWHLPERNVTRTVF